MMQQAQITEIDFQFYQRILLEKSGLALSIDKTYLLHARLTPVAQSLGFPALEQMTAALRFAPDANIIKRVVEAMTTNETLFFRDAKPFLHLRDVILPKLIQQNEYKKTIRIWCAACSSGQEPYSVAMVLDEFFQNRPGWTCQIVGTDISDEVLTQARKGEYSQFEIQRGLTIQMMMKYFTKQDDDWFVKDKLKSMVQFMPANLLANMSNLGMFDIIFCRNVLIYFNKETKEKALDKIGPHLAPEGTLLLGASETLMGLNTPFEALPDFNASYVLKKHKTCLVATA
jgi:chemotaxis protein methyltransferase CheR